MTKDISSQRRQMRELIAQAAARLIAEDGIQDYASAKRKAARQIGAVDTHSLPSNSEVELALRAYQDLYQKDEQALRLKRLRNEALGFMHLLERFNPHLSGSVLNGTATRHSDINIQLFTDNIKDVELFLLNRNLAYQTGEKRIRMNDELLAIPVFTLEGESAEVRVAVFDTRDLRRSAQDSAAGKPLERARIGQLEELLATS